MTYTDKLQHPRWQKKRLEILERDDFTCRWCGNTELTLAIHHRRYDAKYKNPWNYPNYLLLTLCKDCHTIASTVPHVCALCYQYRSDGWCSCREPSDMEEGCFDWQPVVR